MNSEIKDRVYTCEICGEAISGEVVYKEWVKQGKRIDFDFNTKHINHRICAFRELDRVLKRASGLGIKI